MKKYSVVWALVIMTGFQTSGMAQEKPGVPVLLSPVHGQLMDHGEGVVWRFDWSDVPNVTGYQILVEHMNQQDRLVNTYTTESSYTYTFTKDLTQDLMERPWGWWIRARNGNTFGDWTKPFTLHMKQRPPAPELYQPGDNAYMANGSPDGRTNYSWTFDWSDIPGAATYEIRINSPVQKGWIDYHVRESRYVHNQTNPIPNSSLNGWSWQVRGAVDGTIGLWSPPKSFRVAESKIVVPAPQNVSPKNYAKLLNGYGTGLKWPFSWTAVPGASRYELLIGDTDGGTFYTATTSGTSHTYEKSGTIIKEEFLTGWLWKVRAEVNGTWSDWGPVSYFTVYGRDEKPEPINKFGTGYLRISGGFINSYLGKEETVYSTSREVMYGPTVLAIQHENKQFLEFVLEGQSPTEEKYAIKAIFRDYNNRREELGYLDFNMEFSGNPRQLWRIEPHRLGHYQIMTEDRQMALEIVDANYSNDKLHIELKPRTSAVRQSFKINR